MIAEVELLLDVRFPDDSLGTRALAESVVKQVADETGFHQTSHRVWGSKFRDEFLSFSKLLGRALDSQCWLLWRDHLEVAFRTDTQVTLGKLPEHVEQTIGTAPGLILMSLDYRSGITVSSTHYPNADEYEMRTWGEFTINVLWPTSGL